MKGFNKLLLVSAVLSAALSQVSAYKVIDEDDKVVDVYGSVRGYVGYGAAAAGVDTLNNGSTTSSIGYGPYGGAFYSLQTNSRLGVKAKVGNFQAQTELGLIETDGFRQMWGSYTFGSAGTLLFGKADSPSVAKSSFSSDVSNTDQGHQGFSGPNTANRRFQVTYSIAGLSIGLVSDQPIVIDAQVQRGETIPRIAANYNYQNEDKTLDFQVGGAYKYFNKGSLDLGDDRLAKGRFLSGSGSAFHIFAALKSQAMDKRLFLSGMLHYGVNGDLYNEQATKFNDGGYKHTDLITSIMAAASNVHRAGIYAESGYQFSDMLSGVLGLGYQYTSVISSISNQETAAAQTYMVMAQLPIKFDKGFRLTPQIGYYGGVLGKDESSPNSSTIEVKHGLIAFVQARYDF